MSNTIDGIHTTTNPKGTGWVNQANGVVLSSHKTKVNAIASGRLVARRHGTQYTVHRKDGTVIQTRTYAVSPL
jgi:uncharacterized protein DUF2188